MNSGFTKGPIAPALLRFAFPVLFAMLIQSLYGAVDLMAVGRFSDAANVSAVAVGSRLMQSLTLIITEMTVGTAVLLGQSVGGQHGAECGRIVGATVFSFTGMGVALALALQFLSVPAARLLNVPPEAFAQTVAYTRICGAGTVFVVAYNILGSVFRGIGDARLPLVTAAIAAACNALGDVVFVGGLRMGAAGAAIATVAAQAVSVVLSFLVIRRRGMPFSFSRKDIGFHKNTLRRILRIGAPVAMQEQLVSVSFLIVIAIVNRLGVVASAGMGVAEKLCSFIILLPLAFSQAMSTFAAQNDGAGQRRRAEQAVGWGAGLALVCSLPVAYLAFFRGEWLCSIFTDDAEVCLVAAQYLKAYGIDCLLTPLLFCLTGFFSGCARTGFVMAQGVAGAFGVRVPLSLLFSRIEPASIFRIGLATPISSAMQILLCLAYFLYGRRPEKREQKAPADA